MPKVTPLIRFLERTDIPEITGAFRQLGWDKPISLYERYFMEQTLNVREVHIAFVENDFAGYLTICWNSPYPRGKDP